MNRDEDDGLDLHEQLDAWSVPEMPGDLPARVLAQMSEELRLAPPAARPRARTSRGVTLMASVAFAVAAAALVIAVLRPTAEPIEPAAEPMQSSAEPPPVAEHPARRPGHLTITVVPADAIVEVDGKVLEGPSPFMAAGLEPGPHTVRVRRDGFIEWSRTIDVPEGLLTIPMVLTQSPGDGEIVIETPPKPREKRSALEGGLDRDTIRKVMRAHIDEVRACYTAGLVRDPALSGRVLLRFRVEPKGTVVDASVAESTLKDAEVEQCLVTAVKSWRFPAFDGEDVVVEYPWVLEPG